MPHGIGVFKISQCLISVIRSKESDDDDWKYTYCDFKRILEKQEKEQLQKQLEVLLVAQYLLLLIIV